MGTKNTHIYKNLKNPDDQWSENHLETRLYIQHFVTDIPLSFDPFLFQTAHYLNAADFNKKFSFYLFRTGEIPSVACIHFTRNDTGFISASRAPFGGIECDKKCTAQEINFLLKCIDCWCSLQTSCTLKVKTLPSSYYFGDANYLLHIDYELFGYKITEKCINYHIQISKSPFLDNITSAEVRRLAKCKKSGFRAGLYDRPDIKIVYTFIQECRAAKGYLMSMNIAQLGTLITNFPNQCKVFIVTEGSKIIALTVTILVGKGILYNFLPANLPAYQHFSPMVYLTETVYNYCQKEEIKILDLGVSLDNNRKEKPGLLKFKKNLGGIKSFKISYEKQLKSVN